MDLAASLKRFLRTLPAARHAVAYGSAVFSQGRHGKRRLPRAGTVARSPEADRTKGAMVDMIVAVDDPLVFHTANLERNPYHYSGLRYLGAKSVNCVQSWGAGVYYNTFVKWEQMSLKYGIVPTDRLLADLRDWDHLYVAGRFHKPVLNLMVDEAIEEAQQVNLNHAVEVAKLVLGSSDAEGSSAGNDENLIHTIVGLSYTGDIRMRMGEDVGKVQHIVHGQLPFLRHMYGSHMQAAPRLPLESRLARLPRSLRGRVDVGLGSHAAPRPDDVLDNSTYWGGVLRSVSPERCSQAITAAVRDIVSQSSRSQSLKGIFTAGVCPSLAYAMRKVGKGIRSRTGRPSG